MGVLDFLNSNSAPSQPAAAAVPSAAPSYPEFVRNLVAAAASSAKAHPTSLWNAITGAGTDAATKTAQSAAPGAWQQFLKTQNQLASGGLGTARDFASTGALAGVQIDPKDPMSAIPALTTAYGGVLNGSPAPTGGAPASPGGAAPVDPLQAQRAMFLRMGKFLQIQGNAQGANDYFKLANSGLPQDTALLPNGAPADGVTGQPLTTDVGTLLANRAGQKSEAEQVATRRTASHQAGLDRTTHAVNADTDAAHALVNGIDPATGKPVTRTQADILAHPGSFVSNNPYFDGQQAELKDLRTKSESADQGLNLATQISNAANGIYTGKGADAMQNIRKMAQLAGNLTGADTSKVLDSNTSQFEQLKFASQQLVAVASHDLSPRVAQNIYNQIAAVKPGDQTSIRGLRDIINKELIPVFQRNKALYGATSAYYQKNPLTNDAGTHVSDANPISNFGVRDVHSARPGDFYIDPNTGNLRQRPAK